MKSNNDNESPYTKGDKVWHDVHQYYVKTAKTWRTAFFITLLMLGASFFVLLTLASQKKIIPYYVQVDKIGNKVLSGVIGDVNNTNIDNLIIAELSRFIIDVRQTTLDAGVLGEKIRHAYDNILPNSSANKKIDRFFKEHDPFKTASEFTRSVSIDRILTLADTTYQIEWTETTTNRKNGEQLKKENWQAILSFEIHTPTTHEVILKNPAGLFINDYTWGKKL